jgi:hypothetical protein
MVNSEFMSGLLFIISPGRISNCSNGVQSVAHFRLRKIEMHPFTIHYSPFTIAPEQEVFFSYNLNEQ